MSSRDDSDESDEIGVAFVALLVMAIVMLFVLAVYSLVAAHKLYRILQPPEHPKHHWLKPLFGIPLAALAFGLLVSTTDAEAGGTIILVTVVAFWLVSHLILYNAEAVLGPSPVTARLRLESYLHPFDQEPPANRAAPFVLNPQRLTPVEVAPASEISPYDISRRQKQMVESFIRGLSSFGSKS